ncbi:unnamed protein product [Rotaria socialis]
MWDTTRFAYHVPTLSFSFEHDIRTRLQSLHLRARSTFISLQSMQRYHLTFKDVPPILIEPFILRGYRSTHQPWSYYWKSLFHKHNETINVWSHLIGIVYMIHLLYYYNQRLQFFENAHSWPFVVSLCTAIIMFMSSAFAHLLHSKSEKIHKTCFAIDYVGVSLHGFGSGFLHIYYSAPQWYYDKIEYQYIFILLLLARSTSWLDDAGIQAGLLLSDTTTLPWSKSRIQVMNVSSNDTVYAYPNNRQTLEQWPSTPPTFLRLTKTYDYQLVVLTTDGVVVLIPSTDAGYYRTTDDISNPLKLPIACPLGTYKSVSGPTTPCKICPTMAKSYSTSTEYLVVLKVRLFILTLDCIAWSSDSFCPLASISDANKSAIQSKSQVYAYPTSSSMASFDDILMQNTFNLKTSTDANFACGTSLRNTQFSSALQLSATIKSNKETPIFDMLDTQKFTMIVNFLQAGYTCNDVTAQENIGSYSITLPQTNCIIKSDNAALTIIYRVPYHQMTIQLNLAGPYYIGGVLICLTGPSSAINDSSCLVQNLDYCQLYFTSNQTLGQTTEINFDLTKSINQTESLDYSGATNYSSIWILTSIHGSLNDYLVYLQRGAFLRYLYTQHTIMITFSETEFEFDVINKQEPIV